MEKNTVWLMTRPIAMTRLFPKSSDAMHLRHWGVLVTHLAKPEATALMSRVMPVDEEDHTEIGTMYEITRGEDPRWSRQRYHSSNPPRRLACFFQPICW